MTAVIAPPHGAPPDVPAVTVLELRDGVDEQVQHLEADEVGEVGEVGEVIAPFLVRLQPSALRD